MRAPPRRSGCPTRIDLLSPRPVTPSFPSAWLKADPRALAFLPDRFRHRTARAEAVAQAATRTVSPALLAVLRERHARLAPSPARERNLELLGRPGTVAVVTGQQVGLFLGPLFTLYKAASAIVAARTLQEETGRPCVPVFWLQTEDHDLPEVDHCFVASAAGAPRRVSLTHADAATSRVPVAHRRLGDGVLTALECLRAELGREPRADEHLSLLERAYRPEATLAEAFTEVLASIFADEGLVFIDPRDPRLAPLAAPIHRLALRDAAAVSSALARQVEALTQAGFSEQVHIRPGSPLGFFSPDGVDGPRYRLDPAGPDTWSLVGHPRGATVTTRELSDWLEKEPLRFTTSALLRPLLQDTWLPTAAYVGGPGEVSYFAQLAPLYAHAKRPMPLVVPRARFRILDDRARRLLHKLGLTPDEAGGEREALLTRLSTRDAAQTYEPAASVEARLFGAFAAVLDPLGEPMLKLDPLLLDALKRTRGTVRAAVSRLAARYGRALALRDQVTTERLDRLRALLVPDGAPQERILGMAYHACRFGTRDLARSVLDACVPFSGELQDLTP
ncbi:bacillithiol biosynthesis cysteine-adding enzyme BshC [Myxococcus sp. K15C18031901]|uniref:bacillithiol biosynthesis cysteine-adding enzyme BshC n=1 Tax=Myxococcus dinghuensis TaxID=2906761 RepID=UPI0020A788D8|nr:bacillithiol biosynthesis cysteine-adding enzyme BshC [Myxococcus dinghuensis]MCP3100305.1 bacillithiol biosynthesis cysteine-adding enzyme BshC [Myxococcus dinghuensis]